MSIAYWVIEGVGMSVGTLYDKINQERLFAEVSTREHLTLNEVKENIDAFDGDISAFLNETYSFGGLAEMLSEMDVTQCLCYGEARGDTYLYYQPKFPWEYRFNEPKCLDDVLTRFYMVISKVCDVSREELDLLIDTDLFVVDMA